MKIRLINKLSISTLFMCATFTCTTAHAGEGLISALPWSTGIGLKKSEFVENDTIEDGDSGNLFFKQNLIINHPLSKAFDAGFYIKGDYLNSDDTERYWENLNALNYGIAFSKSFSVGKIRWGSLSLTIGQRKEDHHDPIGEPFDATLNEAKLELTLTGDLLK